jgi:hypothetical protein
MSLEIKHTVSLKKPVKIQAFALKPYQGLKSFIKWPDSLMP